MIFEVTEDHLKLVQRMYWVWNGDSYEGAPGLGMKRPYGNSDVLGDIVEILELPTVRDRWDEWTFTDEVAEQARKIHEEMETVLQIATSTLTWEPGVYVKTSPYDARSWERVQDG